MKLLEAGEQGKVPAKTATSQPHTAAAASLRPVDTKVFVPADPATSQPDAAAPSPLPWLEKKVLAWLPATSFAFMIYSSGTAIYQSKGDPGTVAFVAGSLSILGGLYVCMKEFENAVAQRSAKKERLKIAIWLLAMALNTLFSYRVTSVMDSTVFSVIVWSIAGVTTMLGFYLMFCAPSRK